MTRINESRIETPIIGCDSMGEDVFVFPLDCLPGLDSLLRWIEVHLLNDDGVICTAGRLGALRPEAQGTKNRDRHCCQNNFATMQ